MQRQFILIKFRQQTWPSMCEPKDNALEQSFEPTKIHCPPVVPLVFDDKSWSDCLAVCKLQEQPSL